MKEISSVQNPLVKDIVELKAKAAKRRALNLCVIEGRKEIEIAIASGVEVLKLIVENNLSEELSSVFKSVPEQYIVSTQIMDKIALRDVRQSFVAVARTKPLALSDIKLSANPFILILENIEKPGNLGSLLRTADAANVDAVLCTQMTTDIYNANVIRNSLGCVFAKQVVLCSNEDALRFCRQKNITIHSTYLHKENFYYQQNFVQPTAIVFGTESTGISTFWQENSDALIKIPMMGQIDSMNVSNSASILLYEVVRQRLNNTV